MSYPTVDGEILSRDLSRVDSSEEKVSTDCFYIY